MCTIAVIRLNRVDRQFWLLVRQQITQDDQVILLIKQQSVKQKHKMMNQIIMDAQATHASPTSDSHSPREHYWMDLDLSLATDELVVLFNKDDIQVDVSKEAIRGHVIEKMKLHYGERSNKITEVSIDEMVQKHQTFREMAEKEAKETVTDIMVALAIAVGMREKEAKYAFKEVTKYPYKHNNFKGWARLFFVLRGAWEENPGWIFKMEEDIMKTRGWRYANQFKSKNKDYGWVARSISKQKCRKVRLANTNTGFMMNYRIKTREESKPEVRSVRQKTVFNFHKYVIKAKPNALNHYRINWYTPENLQSLHDEEGNVTLNHAGLESVIPREAWEKAEEKLTCFLPTKVKAQEVKAQEASEDYQYGDDQYGDERLVGGWDSEGEWEWNWDPTLGEASDKDNTADAISQKAMRTIERYKAESEARHELREKKKRDDLLRKVSV